MEWAITSTSVKNFHAGWLRLTLASPSRTVPDFYNRNDGFVVPVVPDSPDEIGTSSIAAVTFFDVTSGIHVLHVRAAPDAGYTTIDCSLVGPGGTGGYTGWRQIDGTTFEVMALPDMVNLSARLWCTRR